MTNDTTNANTVELPIGSVAPYQPIVMRSSRVTCTLHHADCYDLLPIEADAVVSDPPYGIAYKKGEGGGRGAYSGMAVKRNIESIQGDDEPFDPTPWLNYPNVILWGANHYAQRLPHGRWIAWNKLGDKEPWDSFSDVEFAWQNGRGKDRIVSHLWKGLCQAGANEKRSHPTQKPLAIMRWCVGLLPDVQTIVDPFMGSGTTGVACVQSGVNFIGVEKDAKYFRIAAERIRRELSQERLF